jgi:hypothetical protein
LQEFLPAQLAFWSVLQPLVPLHAFLPLQQSFAAGADVSVDGDFAVVPVSDEFAQPETLTRMPVTAEIAKALPMFIAVSLDSAARAVLAARLLLTRSARLLRICAAGRYDYAREGTKGSHSEATFLES